MEKMTGGLIAIGILATAQGVAWVCNVDGAVTGSLNALIGLIAGSIFGFGVGVKVTEKIVKPEENK